MNKSILFLFTLLCCISCNEESTIPSPNKYAKLISQVRITSSERTELHDFKYNNRQQILQHTHVTTGGTSLHFQVYDYAYFGNTVSVSLKETEANYLFHLNASGFAETIWMDEKQIDEYTYNSNGYYYQRPTDGSWWDYEYRMNGERCNLDKITRYGSSDADKTNDPQLSSLSFEYGTLLNKANLDLNYFVLGDNNYPNRIVPLSLFDFAGKRSYNHSSASTSKTTLGREYRIEYTYTTDADGYVTRIISQSETNMEDIEISYK